MTTKYVIYDFDARELVNTDVYPRYIDAVDDTDRLNNVMILPIEIPDEPPVDEEADVFPDSNQETNRCPTQ